MLHAFRLLQAATIVALIAACAADTSQPVDTPTVSRPTPIIVDDSDWPARIGSFQRTDALLYGPKNLSVGYRLEGPDHFAVSTVYVFVPDSDLAPSSAPSPAVVHYIDHRNFIQKTYTNVRVVEESPVEIVKGGEPFKGMKGVFSYQARLPDGVRTLSSELFVFQVDDRLVKFRITYPEDAEAMVRPQIDHLINALRWTDPALLSAGVRS